MSLVLAVLATFGAGISALFSWLVNLFIINQTSKQQAAAQMDQDLATHSNDGSISVADQQSLDEQDADLENQKPPGPK